jgi:hypothetical protein
MSPWGQCHTSGTKAWEALQAALKGCNPDKTEGDARYPERYVALPHSGVDAPGNLRSSLDRLDLPNNGYTELNTKVQGATQVVYNNYYHPHRGIIIAGWNYAKYDEKGQGSRLNLSEIWWQEHKAQAAEANVLVTNLQYIFQSSLENQDTMVVIEEAFKRKNVPIGARMQDYDWHPDTDEFLAILGTDNCKTIPYMLIDHMHALGKKTILKIVTHGTAYLYVVVGS